MANLNYVGSLAQTRMKFRSTTEVVVRVVNENFHAMSIYIPKRFAAANIHGWDDSYVTAERPAVFTSVVDNYITLMKGDLLAQWQPIFRQDTNSSVILYLIVFEDSQQNGWEIQDQDISYKPLTAAFQALYPFSYFKFLFDPKHDGSPVTISPNPGSPAEMTFVLLNETAKGSFAKQTVVFVNGTDQTVDIPANSQYSYNSGAKQYRFTILNREILAAAGKATASMTGGSIGPDPNMYDGRDITRHFSPALPPDVTARVTNLQQGTKNTVPGAKQKVTVNVVNNDVGTPGVVTVEVNNTSGSSETVPAALISSAGVTYAASGPTTVADGATQSILFTATTNESDSTISVGLDVTSDLSLPSGVSADVTAFTNGAAPAAVSFPTGLNFTSSGGFNYTVVGSIGAIAPGASSPILYEANKIGPDTSVTFSQNVAGLLGANLPAFCTAVVSDVVAGTNDVVTGTATTADVILLNTGRNGQALPSSGLTVNDGGSGSLTFTIGTPSQLTLMPGGSFGIDVQALTVGQDSNLTEGGEITGLFTGAQQPPAGVREFSTNTSNGLNAGNGVSVAIPSGIYTYNDGVKAFPITFPSAGMLPANGASQPVVARASTVGEDLNLKLGPIDLTQLSPALPQGITVTCIDTAQGINPVGPGSVDVPSLYFDLSLALAVLCKNNISLSWFWSLVKVNFQNKKPSPQDACWIAYRTRQEQLEDMTSLLIADRNRYYWAALYLLNCQNTCVLVHSEPVNIVVEVLAEWFKRRNGSGTFIGNKLSLIRLSGVKIKPMGWPSWLDSSVNENIGIELQEQFRAMNVGYLFTISDNSIQDANLSMARGVGIPDGGIPVGMQMIAKFVDYTCSMAMANMITEDGTLTNPVLADEQAYDAIQRLVQSQLSRFGGDIRRISSIVMQFPTFEAARVSRTSLSAATAWKAWYQDELDRVEVSGGIIAE